MAKLYGTNATKIQKGTNGITSLAEQAEATGRVHTIYDEYVMPGAFTSGDVIQMGNPLPAGSRIISAEFDFAAQGAGALASAGYLASAESTPLEAAQAAAFMAAGTDVSAAVATSFGTSTVATLVGKFKKLKSYVQPTITISTAGANTTGTIRMRLGYIFD